jgi:hypothetical protein
VGALLVAAVLWWDAAGHAVAPGGDHGGAPRGLVAQAATGATIVAHWDPPNGAPPATYQVEAVTAAAGRMVARVASWSPSATLGPLPAGVAYRVVVSGRARATSAPVVVLADRPPDPVLSVVAAREAGTNGLTVRWTPAASGVAASGALVQLYDGPTNAGTLTCRACTNAAFHGLPYGRRYTVTVVPTNDAGPGMPAASNPVVLANPCPAAGACVTVDATASTGAAQHRALGFLNSLYPVGAIAARLQQLAPYRWRGSPNYQPGKATFDWSSWDLAAASGAPTTLLLSNLWQSETNTGAGAKTPWSDWDGYRRWVTATVRAIEASGHRVSYWEVQNEPASPSYYSAADWQASTPADYLEQFEVAYQAIKVADPAAAIVGPSLSHFADYPGQYDPHEIDLTTFLDFAAVHGLKLAAVTWHEIDDSLGTRPRDFNDQPQVIEDHLAEARRLIAERPALGHPQVWVNEYGRPADYALPGWALGDIAALEHARVDQAGRSCWPEPDARGALVDDCPSPTLDGLLQLDGSTPRPDFWVYAAYARMTADLLVTTSSEETVSVLAGRDAHGVVVAMVGRHVSCLPGANLRCAQPATALPAPAPVTVALRLPGAATGRAVVTVARVAPSSGPLPQPPTVFSGPLPVSAGLVVVPVPPVADGEVDILTVHR